MLLRGFEGLKTTRVVNVRKTPDVHTNRSLFSTASSNPSRLESMTDTESLVTELAAGLRLVTGMLGLTVALLPPDDRALVLKALAALESENSPKGEADHQGLATRSSAEAAKALSTLIEKFAGEIRSTGGSSLDHSSAPLT